MPRLEGKVAVITGAGTGIGRATARLFAQEGARVVVAELLAQAGEQTAQLIVQAGGEAIAITTDVTEPDSIQATIDKAVQHYGALHVLHNETGRLFEAMRSVLQTAIRRGAGAEGFADRLPQGFLLPERHAGGRCPRCGTPIQAVKSGGRTGYFCPNCQSKPSR
jgi:NAD(P)-dependent dehydrogenase (short-subunit alcohol dehydrogenase family)